MNIWDEQILAKLDYLEDPHFTAEELNFLTGAWREKMRRDRAKPGVSAGLMFWAGLGVGLWIGAGIAAALILLA